MLPIVGKGAAARRLAVKLIAEPRIELFLSPMGVGILSIALALGGSQITLNEAADFNYHLSQFRRHPSFLHKRHPRDDPARWNAIPAARQALISPAPDEGQPLEDQLRMSGGRFTLEQLVGKLLAPREKWGFNSQEPLQKELGVFTVARFSSECDFGDDSRRHTLGPFLSGLAQVEEPQHAGAPEGKLTVSNAILNRKHWAAIGQLGAAHLVADQPAEEGRSIDFNEQRATIVRDKYFIPYLMAFFQRLVANRLVDEVGQILSEPRDAERALETLHSKMLEFAVSGQFVQVSVREAVHRFYLLAQNGLDVPSGWAEVRRAISDLTAHHSALRQQQLAASQRDIAFQQAEIARSVDINVEKVANVQLMLEWIEIFLVSVYAAHLAEMLFPENHIMVMLAATLGAVATACAVLPNWKQISAVIVVAMSFFVLLFLHHKGALEPFLPRGGVAQTTGHRSVTDEKTQAEDPTKTAHATRGPQDYWIVGSWFAFAALCVVLRMSHLRHGSH